MDDRLYLSILSELKFIASVGENEFLNTVSGHVEPKNIITSTYRAIQYPNETGKSSAEYCRNVIIKALQLLKSYEDKRESVQYITQIRQYIKKAQDGIKNLKATHSQNNMAYALFDTIDINITERLKSQVPEKKKSESCSN